MAKHSGLWSEDSLKGAMAAIRDGVSTNRAPNDYNIPVDFVQSRENQGHRTYVTTDQEVCGDDLTLFWSRNP
jgi:hypothetical protein